MQGKGSGVYVGEAVGKEVIVKVGRRDGELVGMLDGLAVGRVGS